MALKSTVRFMLIIYEIFAFCYKDIVENETSCFQAKQTEK